MGVFRNLYEALIRMVIHVLENQHVSKHEAIFIVFLNSVLEIGILFSANFNYPSSNTQYVSILFEYAQLANTTQLLQSYNFDPTSIALLAVLAFICLVLLILFIYVYSFFYRGTNATTSHRVVLWIFELILKYVGYCLSIPFLHCFITGIGAGLPQTIIAIFGIATISVPLFVERVLIQEDNFLETHYLSKRNTLLNLMNIGYFIFIMIFESHFPSTEYRLPYTITILVYQVYRLYRTITFDYYFFTSIQKLNIFWKALILPVCTIFMVNYILEWSKTRTLTPTEWTVLIMLICKLVLAIHSFYERRVLTNYRNPARAYQADHAIKLMLNQTQLIFNKNNMEYDYSNSDLLSREVLFHKGIIAHEFHMSYRKKSVSNIWKKEELYDPATFSFFRPRWRAQRNNTVKDTPSNSIIALKHFLRGLFEHYTEQFPSDFNLHLSFASYLLHYLRLTPAVIIECFVLSEEMQKRPDVRIGISRERLVRIVNTIQERLARERSDITFSNIDIRGISELEARYSEMVDLMNEYITDYLKFLDELIDEEIVNFDVAYKTGKKLLIIRKQIERIFAKNLSENPFSMAAYSEFLRSVLSEDLSAIEVMKQYQRVVAKLEGYVRADKDCYDINLLFDKNSSIIQASGLEQNLGKILKANPACEKLFSYSQKELQAMNIRNLTPRLISIQHDGFLSTYIDSGRENLIYTNRKLYGRCKEGFLFPMSLIVKPQVDLATGSFLFLGYLKNMNTKNEFIITDQFGLVDSVSKVIGEALGLSKTFLDENLVQMQLICPDTADFFDFESSKRTTSMKGKTMYNNNSSYQINSLENDEEEESKNNITRGDEGDRTWESPNNKSRARLIQNSEMTLKLIKSKNPYEYVAGTLSNKAKNVAEFYTKAFESKDSSKESSDRFFNTDQKYLQTLSDKIKLTKKSKNYCLVQGAVEEFKTSKNTIKIYVFKFTEIEDLFKERVHRHTTRRNESSTKQSSFRKPGDKKTLLNSEQKAPSFETKQKVPGLTLSKVLQPDLSKDDPPKSARSKLSDLGEEAEEEEEEEFDPSLQDDDRGIHQNFESARKNQLPRLLSDLSAILPNNQMPSHRDAEVHFADQLEDYQGNHLQPNRNDSSFEVNLSARSLESAIKSPRSEVSEQPSNRTGKESTKGVRAQKSQKTANESMNSEALDSHRGLDSARNRLGMSGMTDGVMLSHRGLLESERQESLTDRLNRVDFKAPESTSTKVDSKVGSEDQKFNHGVQLMKEIDPNYLQKIVVIEDEEGEDEEYSSDMDVSMRAPTDSLQNAAQASSKKNIKDLFNLFVNQHAGKSDTKNKSNKQKGGGLRSRSSSVTSGTYGSKMVHSAIIAAYYPFEFRQSQFLVVLQLLAAILALIILIAIALSKFSYLQYSTEILDNVNRLVYMVHQMGSAAYDLKNNGDILQDTEEGIIQKATETLMGINTSYYDFSNQLTLFQTEKAYFFNTFPTFRTDILDPVVVVDPIYNSTLPLDKFFFVYQLDAFNVVTYFEEIRMKIDRVSVDELMNDYNKLIPLMVRWINYFKDNSSLTMNLIPVINAGMIAVSIILFALTVLAIWRLFVGMKFINTTLNQLSYVTPTEYSDIKNRILSFRRNLNNKISLNNESAALQAIRFERSNKRAIGGGEKKRPHGTKRKYEEAKLYFFNRSLPIFLLFSFYMIIQGSFKAVMDSVATSVNQGMSNILFFANDEANAIYGISKFKNYTIQHRYGLTTPEDLQTLLDDYHSRISSITTQYINAVEQIQNIFSEEQIEQLYTLLYGNVCPLYPNKNCSGILSGAYEQGFVTGRVAINNDMIQELDVDGAPINKYYQFEELNQAETLAHTILMDVLSISATRIQELLDTGVSTVSGLMAGLVVASIFFFWLLWTYTMRAVIEEFKNSRKMLSLVPVILILRNQRIMSFLKKTSSVTGRGI